MSEESKQTGAFLSALFKQNELIEFRLIESWEDKDAKKRGGKPTRLWSRCEDAGKLLEQFKTANRKPEYKNIYFGIHPRPEEGKGKAADIQQVSHLWIDVDGCTPEDFDTLHESLSIPKASIIVNSGSGIHAYWLLTEPFILGSKADRDHITDIVERLQEAYGGDHTHDVSRILRLPHPELFNVKNARNGRTPLPVTIVHPKDCKEAKRYKLANIASALPSKGEQSTKGAHTPPGELRVTHPATSKISSRKSQKSIATLLASLNEPSDNRSKRDFAVICELIRRGWNKSKTWKNVKDKGKFRTRDKSYFETTWKSAVDECSNQTITHEFVEPETKKVKPFPVDALPAVMRDIIQETRRVCGDSEGAEAAAAMYALATIAASTGNLWPVAQSDVEPTGSGLYFIVVGESGSNKTRAGSYVLRKFKELQSQFDRDYNKQRTDLAGTLRRIDLQKKALESQAIQNAKKVDSTSAWKALEKKIQAKEQEKQDAIDADKGGSWLSDDITPEKLVIEMPRTYDRVAILSSEATVLYNVLGKYGTGSAMSVLTKAYDGETIKRQRKGDPSDPRASFVIVENPSITLVASFTPELWQDMLAIREFKSSGFLQRCLILHIKATRQIFGAKKVNSTIQNKWDSLIAELVAIPVPVETNKVTPQTISVSEGTAFEWMTQRFQTIGDAMLAMQDDMSPELNSWKQRFPIQILHIAALFHMMRHRTQYAKNHICVADVKAAMTVYGYFAEQFELTLAMGKSSKDQSNLSKLMRWAEKQTERFTTSKAAQGIRFVGDVSQTMNARARPVLNHALQQGWLDYNDDDKTYLVTPEYSGYAHKKGK